MKNLKRYQAAALGLLVIAICAAPLHAASKSASSSDATILSAGLNQLPDDIRARWLSLRAQADTVKFGEYLHEGELTIRQLGELIQAVGGKAPTSDEASYGIYSDLQNKLLGILDRIELAVVLKMPDEDLTKLLNRYQGEKDELSTQARQDRQQLIEAGTNLIKKHESDPFFLKYPHRRSVLADLYFRITELLYEETYDKFLEQTDLYIHNFDSLRQISPQAAAALAQPHPDYRQVMAMYQRIVDEFPTSERADDALYNLGVLTGTSDRQSDRASANVLFETLVRIYPDSPYKLNCLRRIGEYYFNPPVNDLNRSVAIYKQIADQFKNSDYYSEALYKLGWCYYRLSDLPTAVEYFAKSLDVGYAGDDSQGGQAQAGLDIASESINYIGVCFAVDPRDWDGAGIDNLAKWLQAHPDRLKKFGRRLVIQLGDIYRHQIGKYSDAVTVYNKFLEMFPLDPRAPEVQSNIVEVYQQGEIYNPQAAHSEKIRYFQSFNPDSAWWQANTDNKLREAVIPVLEKYLDLIIDETLVMASDSKDQSLYDSFELYSRQYLRFWPKGANAYKAHYNLASVIERQPGREVQAMREYWQVVTAYPDTGFKDVSGQRVVAIAQGLMKREKDGEISVSDSGEVKPPVVHAAAQAQAETKAASDTAGTAPKGANRTPLLNSEKLQLAGFDLYLGDFPASPLVPTMLYQAGDILYQHDWFPESREYLEKLLANYPDTKFTDDAYKLVLEGYFKSADYVNAEKTSDRIAAAKVSDEVRGIAKRRKAESVYLTASGLRQGNNHLAAAAEFKRLVMDSPDYQYADRALFQGGLEYMQAKDFKSANEVFTMLADKYPTSEYADKALYNVGFNLQSQMKDLAGAAAVYERLANGYPKSTLTQGALSNASNNYNQVKDDRSAIRVNDLYVQMYPTADDASVYLFENASHYLKLEQQDKANEIYSQFAQKYPDDPRTVQAYFERGKYALDKGDQASASKEFSNTLDTHQKLIAKGLAGSPRYASQALEHLLVWEQEDYNKLRFTGTEAQVKAAKDRKKQWRNALVDKYQQLIRLGQKEAYRSFYAIGALDEDFALATYQQDVPPAKDQQGKIDNLAKVIDEAILLNTVAQQSYKTGFDGLRTLIEPLRAQTEKRQKEYEDFSAKMAELQKDTAAVGIADSLTKLSNMQRALADLDSAGIEAATWSDSCRQKVPEVAFHNGAYLSKLWYANFGIRSNDKDEEVRMLFREEAVKNVITPMAPEICGLYLQAWNAAKEVGLGSKWRPEIETGYHHTVDSLIAQYVDQTHVAKSRIDKLISDFAAILPKGPEAHTAKGNYSDELGGIILDQVDYLNNFNLDMLAAYKLVEDTCATYGTPYGFGEEPNDSLMQFILDESEMFSGYSADAASRVKEYGDKYSQTNSIQWDDGRAAFEDIGTNFKDYSLALLDAGLALRQQYNLSGEAGLKLVAKLVALNPEKYGPQVGLSSQGFSVVSNTDWLVWPTAVTGFQDTDFVDTNWVHATPGGFPAGTSFGVLDSLGAKPIWFSMDKPKLGYAPGLNSGTDLLLSAMFSAQDQETPTLVDSAKTDTTGKVTQGEPPPVTEITNQPDAAKAAADSIAAAQEAARKATADSIAAKASADSIAAVQEAARKAAADSIAAVEAANKASADSIAAAQETARKASADSLTAAKASADSLAAVQQAANKMAADSVAAKASADSMAAAQDAANKMAADSIAAKATSDSLKAIEAANKAAADSIAAKATADSLAAVEAANKAVADSIAAVQAANKAAADSIWQVWMAPDSTGTRHYWFRKSFQIDQQPSSGRILITCDDDFGVYLNGVFISEDGHDSIDWMKVKEYPVLNYLKVGRNVIAVEATDVGNSRQGLVAGVLYEVVPDMSKQLATLTDREMERDSTLKADAAKKLKTEEDATLLAIAASTSPQAQAETPTEGQNQKLDQTHPGLTPAQLRDIRIIEKNKLR